HRLPIIVNSHALINFSRLRYWVIRQFVITIRISHHQLITILPSNLLLLLLLWRMITWAYNLVIR
ncbi:hypothetical protein LINPERPRIM_LOCUS5697, partial [Linum perenne]